MEQAPIVLVSTLAVAACAMFCMWLASLVLKDVSIVDIYWGPGFALIAAVAFRLSDGYPARRVLLLALVALWGLRLGLHLLKRNWGKGEDYRYQAMRARHGNRFAWISLFTVFGLQGALMWFISLPLQVAVMAPSPARWTAWDTAGVLLWSAGFLFESVADYQLARYRSDPSNTGRVMDRGLWALSRHPNYFGDALLWWGFFAVALATPAGKWTVLSPVVMTILLMRVSGVPLLEKKLTRTRPGYAAYAERTSAFIPWFPRR